MVRITKKLMDAIEEVIKEEKGSWLEVQHIRKRLSAKKKITSCSSEKLVVIIYALLTQDKIWISSLIYNDKEKVMSFKFVKCRKMKSRQ